jgi:hypothetical protein
LLPFTSINSKWIKGLNIRPEAGSGKSREYIRGNDFLSRTQMALQLRERIDKWDCMKVKSFCTAKDVVSKLKRLPIEWEKIFSSYISDKGLITRIHREPKN